MALQKQFVQGWTTAFKDVILAEVLHAVAGIPIFGVKPFSGLQAWSDALMQQAADAFSAASTAQTTANTAKYNVASVATAVQSGASGQTAASTDDYASVQNSVAAVSNTATNAAIQVQQQQQTQNAGKGVNKVLTFTGSGALNTTDWTAGTMFVQASNQMALGGSTADGLYLARANYTFATDDQAITFKLGDNANNDQFTYYILRASTDGRTGVALRLSANSLAIGTIAFGADGSTVSGFTVAASIGRSQASSDNGEFRAVGSTFQVLINGNPVGLNYSGTLGNVGASYRNAAVIKTRQTLTFVYYSFNISSFGMYDFGVVGNAITNRVGARIARLSTSPVNFTLANGATALVPANFYSATDFALGMTVTDITTGKIRSDADNWFEFSIGLGVKYGGANDASDFWGQAYWGLMVTKSGDSSGTVVAAGLTVGETVKWALAAGDIAQPVVANVMTSIQTTGTADNRRGVTTPASISQLAGAPGAFFEALVEI